MINELLSTENILNLDTRVLAFVGGLLFIGMVLFSFALKRFFRKKLFSASLQSFSATSFCFAGLLALSIAINLHSYSRLTYEQPIATLTFKQIDSQQFQAKISYQNKTEPNSYIVNGDEWQIDARIIKWHASAQILGLNAQYRLERISGRYSDINDELEKTRTAYRLRHKDDIDYWKLINNYKQWLPWIDAYYGSAAYLPMKDAASYRLTLTQSGLIARPLDSNTEAQLKFW